MHTSDQDQAYAVIDALARQAKAASTAWADSHAATRSGLLCALADALDANTDRLVALADEESGLGIARLTGELARTTFQLRGFAQEVIDGVPYAVVDDAAIAGAPPAGRPHLVRVQRPIGPIAMFSASNFPFAFSVLGGDTASALAAGCPVIVKPHEGHPATSRAVAALANEVLRALGIAPGVFAMIDVPLSRQANTWLVKHPAIAGVAFTGSYQGGVALWRAANERETPIPFFGELGSINPVVVLPDALADGVEAPAKALATSMLQGCGQFCTSPGVIVVHANPTTERFIACLADALAGQPTHRMLTEDVRAGFEDAAARIQAHPDTIALIEPVETGAGPAPRLFRASADAFIRDPALHEEMFGPSALVVVVETLEAIPDVLTAVQGSLTVTLWGMTGDTALHRSIVLAATEIGGRVLFSGVPTGVAVTRAQQHGGPWPASTSPQSTSVGYAALQRFLRPVALQDAPAWLTGR